MEKIKEHNAPALEFYRKDKYSALDAKFEAQKIAFGPTVFQAAKSLRDLGLLEAIEKTADKGITQPELESTLTLSPYAIRVLLEAGLGIGLVLLNDERYTLTRTGYFILHDPMTIANMDFVHDVNYEGFFSLKESLQEGRPAGLKVFGEKWDTVYQALSALPEQVKKSWFAFDHFYSDGSFSKVLPIVFKDRPDRVLDVGGNTGKWAISCVKHDLNVNVTIADLPQQIAMAKDNITSMPEGSRVHYHPLNILEHDSVLPEGFDAVWMSQFLDCFSDEQIVFILKKAVKAMKPDASLFIMETFWDRQKYEAAAFCLQQTSLYFTCIANGNSQMYRSDIFINLIEQAGLKVTEEVDGIGISHTVLKCKKA